MIRRLLIAVVVAGVGFAALHFTIGFENFTRRRGSEGDQPIKTSRSERGVGAGVVVGEIEGSEGDAAISVAGEGRFEMRDVEEFEAEDGSKLFLPVYELVATDSETVAEDLLRLDDVLLTVFRIDRPEDGSPPTATPRGTVRAREALLQVGRDANGSPSIREDRDMDLFGVVLDAAGEGSLRGVHMEVARLRARQTETDFVFRTPAEREPFRVDLDSDPPMTMTGLGLAGAMPLEASTGILSLDVNADPVVERGPTTLRSTGPLSYREDLARGAGRLEMRDDVELDGIQPGDAARRPRVRATADHVIASLARSSADRPAEHSERVDAARVVAWRGMVMTGSPATFVATTPDDPDGLSVRLECERLLVRPEAEGSPWSATAEGSPRLVDVTSGASFTAADRIHLVETSRLLDPIHRAYGFRSAGLGRAVARVFLFEGATQIDDPEHGIRLTTARGLDLFRDADGDPGVALTDATTSTAEDPTRDVRALATSFARGAFELRSSTDGLVLTGNDGFTLTEFGDRRTVRIGPIDAGPAHEFAIVSDRDDEKLALRGHGACSATLETDGSARLQVVDPTGGTSVSAEDATVENLDTLDVRVDAARRIRAIEADGRLARFRGRIAGERFAGEAQHFWSDGRSLRLDGSEGASLRRWRADAEPELATGGRIDVHRIGNRASVHVRAFADGRLARLEAAVVPSTNPTVAPGATPQGGGETAVNERLVLDGERIDVYPSLVPDFVARLHGFGTLPRTGPEGPVLLAGGQVHVVRRRGDGPIDTRAVGDELLLLADARRGLLAGPTARIEYQDEGRSYAGRAPRIRFGGTAADAIDADLLPTGSTLPVLDVAGPTEEGVDSTLQRARIVCDGAIGLDGADIDFGGPVRIRSLDADGEIDPLGLDLSSGDVGMVWDPRSRALRSVTARDGATVSMRGIRADGATIEVDLVDRDFRITGDDDRAARVDFGRHSTTAWMLEVDYEQRTVRAWYGRASLDRTR